LGRKIFDIIIQSIELDDFEVRSVAGDPGLGGSTLMKEWLIIGTLKLCISFPISIFENLKTFEPF